MLRAGISGVCTLALALAFWVAAPVYAQSSGSNNRMSSKSSRQSNSKKAQSQNQAKQNESQPQQKMQISKEAVHALRLTADARQAIINKDESKAKTDVDQALNLLKQVEQKAPTNNNGNTHVVPIYAELEQTSFLQPVLVAKSQTQNSGQQQMANQSSSSGTQMANKSEQSSQSSALPQSDQPPKNNGPEVVRWVEGGFSYIGLDVDAAREHLQAAQQDLKNNKPGEADVELARAQQSADTGAIDTNMPLVRARENLSLARTELTNGKAIQAKADLRAASNALNDYAQNQQAPHARDAKSLSSQIKSSARATNNASERQKIANWWNQLADWTGQKAG